MSTFTARLIETALGNSDAAPLLAIVADPRTCLPDATEVTVLPATESYLADLQSLLAEKKPQRLFLVPPFLDQRSVPEQIRSRYPRMNYEAIALLAALESLPDGRVVKIVRRTVTADRSGGWGKSNQPQSADLTVIQPRPCAEISALNFRQQGSNNHV
jgi:hypothetical protein